MSDFPRVNIKPGQIKHDILVSLSVTQKLSAKELLMQYRHKTKDRTVELFTLNHLDLMRIGGLVKLVGNNEWAITLDGLNRLRELNDAPSKSGDVKQLIAPAIEKVVVRGSTITSWGKAGNYTGYDLRRNCTRPGAYDAYDLPSRFGR
jgi:hypothetical protein